MVPKTLDKTLFIQLQILGAKVERIQSAASLRLDQHQRIKRVREILKNNSKAYWMQQYHDDIHYIGYRKLANITQSKLGRKKYSIVGAIGTGCSTGGLINFLRKEDPEVGIIGVEPFGSISFGAKYIDDPDTIIPGIGSAIPFKNIRHELYDKIHWISSEYATFGTIELFRRYGIFAGLSSSCSYLSACWEAKSTQKKIIFITAETGYRYMEKIFSKYGSSKKYGNSKSSFN